jgi:ubiquitin C-terminal hydrolase
LTRVNDLKEKILNFKDINKDINTNGQLTKEFKKILYKIENDEEGRVISPDKLKRVMANIDERYTKNHQEDANEFISFFLNALISETANKNKVIDKIEVYDKNDEDAFNKFYKKFYIKKGYSFVLELFYGIIKNEKICKSCKERNFIKFSSFNVLDLPIYSLAKSNKILDLKEILNKYLSEYKNNGFTCIKCNANNVYTNTTIYSLPKYLILFFARIVEKEYLYNEIKYPEQFNFNEYTNNSIKIKSNYNYKLECVIEHSGGAYSGHYTALCRILDNCWYDFSDSYGYMHSKGFESKNAIILLYKAQ